MNGKKKIYMALYLIMCVVFIFQIINQRNTLARLKLEYDNQVKVLKEKEEENKSLKDILEKMDSDEFIEKEARERFNMIKEGEIPVKNEIPKEEKKKKP